MTTDNLLTEEKENEMPFLPMMALEGTMEKPAGIPEKFWDAQEKAIRVDALLQSYVALERKMSTMVAAPESADDMVRIRRMLGVPETADGYEVSVPHGLFSVDTDVNKRLHERGFTPEQVQAVYDLAAEKLVPMILELSDEFKADREIERLIAAFGGPEKWQEVSRQLLAYGRKNLPPDVLTNLASSFEGVMALHRMMKGGESAPALSRDVAVGDTSEIELRGMMRDPRYWRERDPSFVAKVTEGFQRIYSDR